MVGRYAHFSVFPDAGFLLCRWSQDPSAVWAQQADPNQWAGYYGYGQGYDAYAYGASQDPSFYAYGAYAGYGQYPQQAGILHFFFKGLLKFMWNKDDSIYVFWVFFSLLILSLYLGNTARFNLEMKGSFYFHPLHDHWPLEGLPVNSASWTFRFLPRLAVAPNCLELGWWRHYRDLVWII